MTIHGDPRMETWSMGASNAFLPSELLLSINMILPTPRPPLMGSPELWEMCFVSQVEISGVLGSIAPVPASAQLFRRRVKSPDFRNSFATLSNLGKSIATTLPLSLSDVHSFELFRNLHPPFCRVPTSSELYYCLDFQV